MLLNPGFRAVHPHGGYASGRGRGPWDISWSEAAVKFDKSYVASKVATTEHVSLLAMFPEGSELQCRATSRYTGVP